MNYLKIALFVAAVFFTFEGNAQTKNSFIMRIDSLEIDIYNNYESDSPPINLNNLNQPALFMLNGKELKISEFSELKIGEGKIKSVTVIQNPDEIKEMGYSGFNSIVKIKTEKEE